MFWDVYLKLCNSIGKAPSAVAKEMGFSNAAATGWKNGAMPRSAALAKISDYFNVPVETFLGGFEVQEIGIEEETENPPPVGDGLVDKISALAQSPGLLEELNRFLELAAEDPETARRFLAFAVQELQSSRPSR